MRIALLSALAENPTHKSERLAFRRFVGRSVLAHQVDIALALECESIIVLAGGLKPEIIACQHRAEAGGAKFQTVDNSRRLSALVTASDEVVVLADGLLPDRKTILADLASHARLLVLPSDPAVSNGFERIDAERAWAGAMRLRGSAIEGLAELPDDVDAFSALLRIALQSGISTKQIDPDLLAEGVWTVQESAQTRQDREKRWIGRYVTPVPFSAPGLAVAERMGIRLARDFVGGRLEKAPWFVATASGVLAGLAAFLGRPAIGLGLALLMVFADSIGDVFERLSRAGTAQPSRFSVAGAFRWVGDALIIGLVALASPAEGDWIRLFIPVILLGLLRLGERTGPIRWRAAYADRILLLTILAAAAFFGQTQLAAAVTSLIVLLSLFFDRDDEKLTSD